MRRIAKEAEIEMSVKMALALLIGLPLSGLMGWKGTMTISFAIILVTYLNRGFYGAQTYYVKRMQTQVLMCILLYFEVFILKTYTPLPSWAIILIAEVPVALFVYYLFFGWNFAPMNLSPIVGPMMILNTAMTKPEFFTYRVVFTFIGCVIGWGITMVYPFSNKVERTEKSLKNLAEFTTKEFGMLSSASGYEFSKEYKKAKADIEYEITEINSYLAIVYNEINTWKYRKYTNDVPRIKEWQKSVASLNALANTITAQAANLKNDEEFAKVFIEKLKELEYSINKDHTNIPSSFSSLPLELLNSPSRIALSASLVKCQTQLTQLGD